MKILILRRSFTALFAVLFFLLSIPYATAYPRGGFSTASGYVDAAQSFGAKKGRLKVAEGVDIFYEVVGSGPAVLVPLHMFLFKDFKHLAKGRTMVFYDVRNRGRSGRVEDTAKITIQDDVEDIEALRKHFGFEKISLIGESYTGLMVVMYAMKYPERVDKIVQIGPVPLKFGTTYPKELTANDPSPVPAESEWEKLDKLRAEGFHKEKPKDFCEMDWAVSRKGLVGDPANASKIDSPCSMENEWPVNLERHFGSHFVSVQKLDIPQPEIGQVKLPVLTVHGTKDRNAPYGAGKEWVELLPNAELVTVEGAAHFPWVDAPDAVFSPIDGFLPKAKK